MPENRIRVAPNTVAYADEENLKLVVELKVKETPSNVNIVNMARTNTKVTPD